MAVIRKKSKNIILALLLTALVVCIAFGVVLQSYTYNVSFSDTEIRIDGDDGVTVYVSGRHVSRDENGVYSIAANDGGHDCKFAVTVVNERAVSTKLTVSVGGQAVTSASANYFETTITGNPADISVSVETATPTEAGSSFSTAYPVATSEDFIALSKILMSEESDAVTEENKDIYNGFLQRFDYGVKPDENNYVDPAAVNKRLIAARDHLYKAYFLLTENVLLNASIGDLAHALTEGFFGIGAMRGKPFAGCFDFNGHYVNMVVTATEMGTNAFAAPEMTAGTEAADHEVMSIGLFGRAAGNGVNASLIRGANVRGSIAVTSKAALADNDGVPMRIYAGGLVGMIGERVVLDDISSSVSISATSKDASIYAGGIFGFSSANAESWSNAFYDGTYATVEAITDGENAAAMVGSFAGILQNAYVHSYSALLDHTNLIANAQTKGDAVAGGVAAIAYLPGSNTPVYEDSGTRAAMEISEIDLRTNGAVISAETNHANAVGVKNIDPAGFFERTDYGAAVSGGLVGILYNEIANENEEKITLSGIRFTPVGSALPLSVQSGTRAADSNGITFAGGLIGYIYDNGSAGAGIDYRPNENAVTAEGTTVFECSVSVSSVQNGYGPAYAGGLFGYGAFRLRPNTGDSAVYTFNLTSETASAEIEAVQTSLTRKIDQSTESLNDVVAGFYSSRLPEDYFINHLNINIRNGSVAARREAGSTAVGDVVAGGLAGQAFGTNGSAQQPFRDVKLNFANCTVQALGYSFNSDYGSRNMGNNAFGGGFIGYAEGYGVPSAADNTTTNHYGFNVIKAAFTGSFNGEPAVYCVQNAVASANNAGYGNYCSEGYVGGMFGMLAECSVTDLSFVGDESRSLIRLSATNDPDTTGAGGLIGTVKLFKRSENMGSVSGRYSKVQNCSIANAHVAATAYSNVQNGGDHDLYAGGAIGSVSTCEDGGEHDVLIANLSVDNCAVESVGEQRMLTYAGGAIGGVYYTSVPKISNCIVTNSSVLASSASYGAISGGLVGLLQYAKLQNCYAVDTFVRAFNVLPAAPSTFYERAFAAGIVGRNDERGDVQNGIADCYTNASVSAEGRNAVKAGICVITSQNNKEEEISVLPYGGNYYVKANVFADLNGGSYCTITTGTENPSYTDNTPYWVNVWFWGRWEEQKTGTGITLAGGGNNLNIDAPEEPQWDSVSETLYPDTDALSLSVRANPLEAKNLININEKTVTVDYSYTSAATIAAALYFEYGGKRYILCSYSFTINDGVTETGDVFVKDEEGVLHTDGAFADNVYGYFSERNYTYFRIHVGDTVKSDYFEIYDTAAAHPAVYESTSGLLGRDDKKTPSTDELQTIINGGNARSYTDFKDKANIDYTDTGDNVMFFEPLSGAFEHYAVIFRYGEQYVVIEVVPNELMGIKVSPSRDTPPRGKVLLTEGDYTGETAFVYAPEDTVRLDAETNYINPYEQNVVDVRFEAAKDVNGVTVRPNGTVEIGAATSVGEVIPVRCFAIADETVETYLYIYVTEEIVVETNVLAGARYAPAGNVNGVQGQPFAFTLTPLPGYGLNPAVTLTREYISGGSESFSLSFGEQRADVENGEIVAGEFPFAYSYNAVSGVYTITMPAEFMDGDTRRVVIDAVFDKVYTLVFDLGDWADGTDGVTRRITYTLKGSTAEDPKVLDKELFAALKELIYADVDRRFGFTFKGFYSTDDAVDLASYGASFKELCESEETLYSSRTFYARWNYTVILEAPEGVRFAGTDVIPVNTLRGFTFNLATSAWFAGTPRFDVFIAAHDETGAIVRFGEAVRLGTDDFFVDEQGNFVLGSRSDLITGTILIKVYNDNLAIAAGETAAVGTSGISLRADGVFTVYYGVNFGDGVTAESVKETVFTFSQALPEGSSVRLFTHYNNAAYSVGYLELNTPRSQLSTADFTITNVVSATPANVQSAGYYLVVTLPINANSVSGATDVSAKYSGTLSQGSPTYYDAAEGYPSPSAQPAAPATVIFAAATVYSISESGGRFVMTVKSAGDESVADLRRAGKFHVWRIVTDENIPAVAGEILRTQESRGTVIYVAAQAGGTLDLYVAALAAGTTVELLETVNTHYPATDIVLDRRITEG